MKPVYQNKFGNEGNCLQACIASLLELPLSKVPNFIDTPAWINQVNKFMRTHGYYMETQTNVDLYPIACFYLGWGKSPRGLEHSVIYYNGELYHDPHPEGGGIELEMIAYFVGTFNKETKKDA